MTVRNKYRPCCLIIFLLCNVFVFSQEKINAAKQRSNIVLIIADDVSWNDFGCYGNKIVKTPHIDKLAKNGLKFTNTYLTASSCSPSRCSIISGKYPHSNGAAELHEPLPVSEIPFPLLLKENGYYTAQAGKWHLGPYATKAFDRYTDTKDENNGNAKGGEGNWVKFIKERPKDKPFFFWLASNDAHRGWSADKFHITHNPDKVNVPVYLSDTPKTRKDIASYYNEIGRFDFYIGEVVSELRKQNVLENTMIIVMADNGRPFPRCKTRVYDSGMKTPFIIYYPKLIKKKGKQSNSLISSIDIAPTLLEIAEIKIPNDYQGISFTPILKQANKKIRKQVFSEHNWHDYEAHERMLRDENFLYVLNSRPNLTNGGSADSKRSPSQTDLNKLRDLGKLTDAQADVFVSPRPREELFDIRTDSLQLLNLASHEKYKEVLNRMRKELKTWQRKTNDTIPDHLTPDLYDRETGKLLDKKKNHDKLPRNK